MKIAELFEGRVFTFSNFLSILRVLLIPVLWYTLDMERATGELIYKYYSIVVVTLIVLSDFLDGFLARLLNQVSRLGQFLDPVSDKIAALLGCILIIYYKDFPIWVGIFIFVRDIINVIAGFLIFSEKDIQVRPNMWGKCTAASLGVAGYVYVISPSFTLFRITLQNISIFFILVFMILGMVFAVRTYSKIYFGK